MVIKGKATVKYNNGASITPKGNLTVTNTESICSIEGGGKIDFDRIDVNSFSYRGNVNCVGINAKGDVSISGVVSAKIIQATASVSIIFSNNISVGDVCATTVEIKPTDENKLNLFSEFLSKIVHITIDKKENICAKIKNLKASEIKLTNCDVDVIVCDKIELSGKCRIKKLICSEDVKTMGNEVKINSQEKKSKGYSTNH